MIWTLRSAGSKRAFLPQELLNLIQSLYLKYKSNWNLWKLEKLPSREQLSNLSPAVSKHAVSFEDDEVLLRCPWWLLHIGVEVIVPALSTLLSQSALQMLGYHSPLFVPIQIYKLYNLSNNGQPVSIWDKTAFHLWYWMCCTVHSQMYADFRKVLWKELRWQLSQLNVLLCAFPTFSSSSLVQEPLTNSGSRTLNQRCWHWCSVWFWIRQNKCKRLQKHKWEYGFKHVTERYKSCKRKKSWSSSLGGNWRCISNQLVPLLEPEPWGYHPD